MKKKLIISSLILILGAIGILIYDNIKTSPRISDFPFFGPVQKKEVNLILGGDIMLSRGIGRWAKKEGYNRTFANGSYHPLSGFSSFLSGKAILIFNLESPFSTKDNDQPQGGFIFRANPKNIQILNELKGDNQLLLSLANNHSSNAGGAGIALTREILKNANIHFAGAANTQLEAETFRSTITNEIKICFQAYSYDGQFNKFGNQFLAWNPLNEKKIKTDLEEMKNQNCDLKIISLHRGKEYQIQPQKSQIKLAHTLIDAGADIILGNHSHVPGSYEIYQGKPIFYSMGNLLFDQDRGMNAKENGFDYIWDYELKKRTVPTYIPLLAELKIIKNKTGIQISTPTLKLSRIKKGKYSALDAETTSGILTTLQQPLKF